MLVVSLNVILGELGVVFAFAFCAFGCAISFIGARRRDPRLVEVGRRAALPTFAFTTLAIVVLEIALLGNDFGVRYVANHSASTSPLWVKIVSLWGALEGSILLWAWLLALYTFLVSRLARADALRPYALAVMFFVLCFFLGVNASVGSPFIQTAISVSEGNGPNALLQNHWMMSVHPLLMYLGFVGLSVPFAYAVAAMFTGRLGETWITQTRRWTILAWTFLSAAIVAGGWWSYEVLGWGGSWAWDPVENASIIPWFLATAFIHSLQIQERRRILKGWNLGLITAAFIATLLGTFLTRSGIVQSVHAFASGPIGPVFLGFLVLVTLAVLALAYWRLPQIRDDHQLDSPISREGAFLLGNVLFASFAATVLIGTLFPVFVELIRGDKTSVGPPFFNQVGTPLGLAILFLQGLGPALTWRRVSGDLLRKTLVAPIIIAVVSGGVAFVLGIKHLDVLLTLVPSVFNIAVLLLLTGRAARQRAQAVGSSWLGALGANLNTYPRRYGAYIAHFGVVVIAIGIAFSSSYKSDGEYAFRPGETKDAQGVQLQYVELLSGKETNREIVAAEVRVDGVSLFPRLNYYGNTREPVATPGIRYTALGDTYLTLSSFDQTDRSVVIKLIRSPLVSWIWVGGLILCIGAALTMIPATATQPSRRRSSVAAGAG